MSIKDNTVLLQSLLDTVNSLPNTRGSVQADWNQTDDTAPDFIKNRPFGYCPSGSDTLTFDGNTEGLESTTGFTYKVSNACPTLEDFANGATIVVNDIAIDITSDWLFEEDGVHIIAEPSESDALFPLVMLCSEDFYDEGTLVFSKGTHFAYVPVLGLMVSQLTVPGYTEFGYVQQIDKKYLPQLSTEDVPPPKFYVSSADNYIYTDLTCTIKATKDDIPDSVAFDVGFATNGFVLQWMMVGSVESKTVGEFNGYRTVALQSGSSIARYYTSEYTPTA